MKWGGNTNTYCKGLITFSKNSKLFLFSIVLLICLSLFMNVYCFLQAHISVGFLYLALWITVMTLMIRTVLKDPGILPKHELSSFIVKKRFSLAHPAIDRTIVRMVNKDHLHRMKFCRGCKIFRPPRTAHCYTCENCVE